ncbi:hypothetical protein BGZ92_008350 [Podila epicladia]|nr:hypothetical protein BGZ92_008350 [Podila epicladia]
MFAARAPKAPLGAKGTSSKQNGPRPEQPHSYHHNSGSSKASSKSTHTSSTSPSSTFVVKNAPAWRTLQEDQDETMHAEKTCHSFAVGDDSLYYNTRKTIVALFGPLPREVEEALAKTDFYREPMTAKVDVDAGYGVVVSKSKCYIWAVQKSTTYRTPPPCYTLPMPPNSLQSIEASVVLPSVIITNSDDYYSGLLACSPDGTCWYWDNIELSVSNSDKHVDAKINLMQDDHISHAESAGPMGYYFATKQAQVHQITVKKQYGAAYLVAKQLSAQAGGKIATIFNLIGMGQAPDTTQKMVSLTSGPKLHDPHGRWELFSMTRRSLIKWQLPRSGDPVFEVDIPLSDQITEKVILDLSLRSTFGIGPNVRLLDVKYIRNGRLLVLASFFESHIQDEKTPLTYGLITLSSQYGKEYDIDSIKYIRRATEEDPRPEAAPKLVVPHGGPRVFIITPVSVIIKSTEAESDFEEILPLSNDRVIGYGSEDWRQRSQQSVDESEREISLVCRKSGLLGINVGIDNAPSTTIESEMDEEYVTTQLLAKLEQAVYYGNKQYNPISFDLTIYKEGDLNKASLKVNEEILNSHSGHLSLAGDMTTRLRERFLKAQSIIDSINRYKMLGFLSLDTRFKLCSSAEKLSAANVLWRQYQLGLASKERSKESKALLKQVLRDAVDLIDHKLAETKADDLITLFLKYDVEKFGVLLSNLHLAAGKLKNVSESLREELTRDINSLIILSLQNAWNYRVKNINKYNLKDGGYSVEPWTANEHLINALTAQYGRTLAACKASQVSNGSSMDIDGREIEFEFTHVDSELKDHLYELADVALQANSDRLAYLENLPLSDDNEVVKSLADKDYENAKLALLGPLVGFKDTQPAKKLAEKFNDFSTLVRLCKGDRIMLEEYINRYQQHFADALFKYYIDQNQVSTLMEHGDQHSVLFASFLDDTAHDDLAWLHDIKIKRYEEASHKVGRVARQEKNLDHRETALSLSKLLLLAEDHTDPYLLSSDSGNGVLDSLDQDLEFATIQKLVTDEWSNMVRGIETVEYKTEMVVDNFGSSLLAEQPNLREALMKSARTLLNREVLGSEDLLDVLMVQQKREIENMDVADVALGICMNAADIPDNRRDQALADVWRRIYLDGSEEDAFWKLSETNDIEAREKLMHTWMARAYSSIYAAGGTKDDWLLDPEFGKCSLKEEVFRERFQGGSRSYKLMMQDYERENTELERRIRQGDLLKKWRRCKEIVVENAKEAERDLKESLAEVEMQEEGRDVEMEEDEDL